VTGTSASTSGWADQVLRLQKDLSTRSARHPALPSRSDGGSSPADGSRRSGSWCLPRRGDGRSMPISGRMRLPSSPRFFQPDCCASGPPARESIHQEPGSARARPGPPGVDGDVPVQARGAGRSSQRSPTRSSTSCSGPPRLIDSALGSLIQLVPSCRCLVFVPRWRRSSPGRRVHRLAVDRPPRARGTASFVLGNILCFGALARASGSPWAASTRRPGRPVDGHCLPARAPRRSAAGAG
jgi:hypothetical protein